jgi:hypothetical protein
MNIRCRAGGMQGLLAALLVAVSGTAIESQRVAAQPESAPALRIRYADGRSTTRVLRPKGGMWTPEFPRVAGAQTGRNGHRLAALDVAHVMEGSDAVVTVSLLYGSPHQGRVKVAIVRVASGSTVSIPELRGYGVEPISLSIVHVPLSSTYLPAVSAASGQLELSVEAAGEDVALYKFRVTNHSARAVIALHVEGRRGERIVLSGRRRGPRNHPLIKAGGTFEYTTSVAVSRSSQSGENQWPPIDYASITSVLWEDGVVEGNPLPAVQERVVYADMRRQLDRVLEILRRSRSLKPEDVRAQVAGLSIEGRSGMQQAKDAVLSDFDTSLAAGQGRPGKRGSPRQRQLIASG